MKSAFNIIDKEKCLDCGIKERSVCSFTYIRKVPSLLELTSLSSNYYIKIMNIFLELTGNMVSCFTYRKE